MGKLKGTHFRVLKEDDELKETIKDLNVNIPTFLSKCHEIGWNDNIIDDEKEMDEFFPKQSNQASVSFDTAIIVEMRKEAKDLNIGINHYIELCELCGLKDTEQFFKKNPDFDNRTQYRPRHDVFDVTKKMAKKFGLQKAKFRRESILRGRRNVSKYLNGNYDTGLKKNDFLRYFCRHKSCYADYGFRIEESIYKKVMEITEERNTYAYVIASSLIFRGWDRAIDYFKRLKNNPRYRFVTESSNGIKRNNLDHLRDIYPHLNKKVKV